MVASQSLVRRLKALGIHVPEGDFCQDEGSFRHLVTCLYAEIRHSLDDQFDLTGQFDSQLQPFLLAIRCPYSASDKPLVLDWCLVHALRCRYNTRFGPAQPDVDMEQDQTPADQVDTWDLSEHTLADGVKQLAATLDLLPHPKPVVTLRAIALYLSRAACGEDIDQSRVKGDFDILKLPLGFHVEDAVVQKVARIMRLLLLSDLRQLQNQINHLLVAAQQITAHPKTDTALGKVGR